MIISKMQAELKTGVQTVLNQTDHDEPSIQVDHDKPSHLDLRGLQVHQFFPRPSCNG